LNPIGRKWWRDLGDGIMKSYMTSRLTKYFLGDQIKDDESVRECRMHGRDENTYTIMVEKPEGKSSRKA
jgi:hypothetical protein